MLTRHVRTFLVCLLLGAAAGCDTEKVTDPAPADPPPKTEEVEARKVPIKPNLFLEVQGDKRRVLVSGTICLQKGALELLMTRKNTKEHEAVIAADVDARDLHSALLLAKAEAGAPVQFQPRYQPARGQKIKITVEYQSPDKTKPGIVRVDARELIRDVNTRKTLTHSWVFTGSKLIQNPLDKNKVIFLANDGDLVCVSNFESALLDLPIKRSKENAELVWEANSDKIPPEKTPVTVIFEPEPDKSK
jgi:hypothetical protein